MQNRTLANDSAKVGLRGILGIALALLRRFFCLHSADYREPLEMTFVRGLRGVRFRCLRCGSEFWQYHDRPLL